VVARTPRHRAEAARGRPADADGHGPIADAATAARMRSCRGVPVLERCTAPAYRPRAGADGDCSRRAASRAASSAAQAAGGIVPPWRPSTRRRRANSSTTSGERDGIERTRRSTGKSAILAPRDTNSRIREDVLRVRESAATPVAKARVRFPVHRILLAAEPLVVSLSAMHRTRTNIRAQRHIAASANVAATHRTCDFVQLRD
jgi:hypothetical protein